jgi:hypothetical protein
MPKVVSRRRSMESINTRSRDMLLGDSTVVSSHDRRDRPAAAARSVPSPTDRRPWYQSVQSSTARVARSSGRRGCVAQAQGRGPRPVRAGIRRFRPTSSRRRGTAARLFVYGRRASGKFKSGLDVQSWSPPPTVSPVAHGLPETAGETGDRADTATIHAWPGPSAHYLHAPAHRDAINDRCRPAGTAPRETGEVREDYPQWTPSRETWAVPREP